MKSIKEYAELSRMPQSTIYNQVATGKLHAVKLNGKLSVVASGNHTTEVQRIERKNLKNKIKLIKQQLDEIIVNGAGDKPSTVKIITDLVSHYQQQGITIKGYNAKSVYRKIDAGTTRKTRADKFSVRNRIINENFAKIKKIASYVYFANAQLNLNVCCDLVLEYARRHEDCYEIAAIPKSTLYNQLRLDFQQSGYSTLHEYINHHNIYRDKLPTATGAFTDGSSMKFFDFIIGDNHQCDVAVVFVYDEILKKVVRKQVKIWFWMEAVTMYPLGWIIKTGDFTSEDLIKSLSEVVFQYGLPNKTLLIDNGIGRSDDFKTFWKKLSLKNPSYSEAYTPTNKATGERSFGLFKKELDSFQTNFVGPFKEMEARHSGAALSPEECNLFFEEYKQKLENYLTGFYIERKRTRVIENKTVRISIKEYFNRVYQDHEQIPVTPQDIRFAMSREAIREFNFGIKFKHPAADAMDVYQNFSEVIPASFNRQQFRVLYNPYDPEEIDLYAIEDMLDRESGAYYAKGGYVTTLSTTRFNKDRQKAVKILRKKLHKEMKAASEAITALGEINEAMPDRVAPNSQILQERKEQIARTEVVLKQTINRLSSGSGSGSSSGSSSSSSSSQLSLSEDGVEQSLTYEEE